MTKEAHNVYRNEWRRRNPEKVRAQERRHRLKYPEKHAAAQHRNYLKYRDKRRETSRLYRLKFAKAAQDCKMRATYGIGIFDYLAMYWEQKGTCASCKDWKPQFGKTGLVIDHCHESRKVRSLLCVNCNLALGHLRDDCVRALALVKYMEEYVCQE